MSRVFIQMVEIWNGESFI